MNLAVLIDAENFSPPLFDEAMRRIDDLGRVVLRRALGDFSQPSMVAWKRILERWPVTAIQVTPLVAKRNSTDMRLAIEAMDILHRRQVEGFCILASDSDYSALVLRLREDGATVYGIGESKAHRAYASVFDRFITCDAPEAIESDAVRTVNPTLVKTVKHVLSAAKSEDGWVPLSLLGKSLRDTLPGFEPRAHGFGKLSDLIRCMPGLEWKAGTGTAGGAAVSVRQASRASPAPQRPS